MSATHTHPLTGETVTLADGEVERMRAELEASSGLDLSDMKVSSVLMNYNAKLKREGRKPMTPAELAEWDGV